MCGFTKDGYTSKNFGKVFFDADLENLRPEIIEELSSTPATGWSIFLISRNIEELKKAVKPHVCPADVEGIKKLIREEIGSTPKRLRDKIMPVLKDLVIIGTLAVLLLQAYGVIKIN